MNSLRKMTLRFLVPVLVLNTGAALADDSAVNQSMITLTEPQVEALAPGIAGVSSSALPQVIERIAALRARQEAEAPEWVKELRTRTVGSYFRDDVEERSAEWRDSLARLRGDAVRLHEYFESEDEAGKFKKFTANELEPFLKSLDKTTLSNLKRGSKVSEPIESWTVERMVVIEQMMYLTRFKNFPKQSLELLTGKHLKGISFTAAGLVIAGGVSYLAMQSPAVMHTLQWILGGIGTAIAIGPGAEVAKSLTGPILGPTNEQIAVLRARYFGNFEKFVNWCYDSSNRWFATKGWRRWVGLKPLPLAEMDVQAAKNNVSPNAVSPEEDHVSLAGMTVEQQGRNWTFLLRVWVAIRNTFMQMLRDVHHIGRVQMLINPHDEQAARNLISTLNGELNGLELKGEGILDYYRMRIMSDGHRTLAEKDAAVADMVSTFELFDWVESQQWRTPWMDNATKELLAHDTLELRRKLKSQGFSDRDLGRLQATHTERNEVIKAMVTGLSLNVIRTLMTPEAGRNLDEDGRKFIRAIREGFGLEAKETQYIAQVQQRVHKSGFDIGEWDSKNNWDHARGLPRTVRSDGGYQCGKLFIPTN